MTAAADRLSLRNGKWAGESRIRTLTGDVRGTIPEVAHQRAFSPLSAKSSEVNFIIETQNAAHATEVVTALRAAGFEVRRLEGAGPGGF